MDEERAVRLALRRRGILCGPARHLGAIVPASPAGRDRFYGLLKHYSFRLFLRDLIRFRQGAQIAQLTRYCSPAVARRYADALCGIGVARERRRGLFELRDGTVRSFGPTLEWFAARALNREFGLASAWGLRPQGARPGGDYDVVGCGDGALVYIELKASPPRNIESNQVTAFVDRVAALSPDVAVLINDTQLRMLDKLVPALRVALRRHSFGVGRLRRVQGEIFSRGNRLFVTNSEPDLIGNLGVCLATFFRSRFE